MGSGGGSGSGGGCVTVGYAYFLSFAYVYAEKLTGIDSVYLDGDRVWNTTVTSDQYINFKTGKPNDTAPSGNQNSNVWVHFGGDYPMPFIGSWTGSNIKYKYVSALIFPDAYIGDGVRQIPTYGVLGYNDEYYKVHPDQPRKANPINVIYDILKRDLQMPDSMIDVGSFQQAAATIESEGIFVGVVMDSEKKVSKWFEDLLRIVDGTMYYDPVTKKLTIKLLRFDYDPNNVQEITDDVISDVVLEATSWAETYNQFIFKFTDYYRDKVRSVEYTNEAARISLGYARPKTISLTAINNQTVLNIVANRMMAKLGTPKTSLKFKVNYIDYPGLIIGGVFKLNSAKLGISGKIFRVMKISGDEETTAYLQVEAVEDFYAKDLNFDIIDDTGDDYVPPDYTISTPPTDLKVIDAPREINVDNSVLWFAGQPENTSYVTAIDAEIVGTSSNSSSPFIVCELLSDIPVDITGGPGSSPKYNREYTFVVKDTYGYMYEIFGNDNTLQIMRHIMLIGDELVAFKSASFLGTDGRYEVTGILRGVGETPITAHTAGEKVYINQLGDNYDAILRTATDDFVFRAYARNHTSVGPSTSISATYNGTQQKPYKPVPYIKNGKIVWRPRVAFKGANYRAPDTITAGQGEGTVTGYYVVRQPNGAEVTITPQTGDILIEFTPTQNGVHQIKHVNADTHKDDGWVSITV